SRCFGKVTELDESVAEDVMRLRAYRLKGESLAKSANGLSKFTQFETRGSEIEPCRRMPRCEVNSSTQRASGVGKTAETLEGVPLLMMGFSETGVQAPRSLEIVKRFSGAANRTQGEA